MMDEIKFFATYSNRYNSSFIQTNLFILDPYPGTAVSERFVDKYIPMRYFRHPYPNVWCDKNSVHIQMELTRLVLSKLLCIEDGKELFIPFIDFIHKIQHDKIADVSLASSVYDKDLRSLAEYVMESIAEMNFIYDPTDIRYGNNIINMLF